MERRLLVTGGSGFVGGHVLAAARRGGWHVISAGRSSNALMGGVEFRPLDVTNEDAATALLADLRPQAVIHCAAVADVDQAEGDPYAAWRVNAQGTAAIARAAAQAGTRLVFASTSTVFDGRAGNYSEDDPPNPVNVYGRTKLAAELAARALHPTAAIARISMAYGRPVTGGASFLMRIEEALRSGRPTDQPGDEFRTPIDALTCAEALVELAGTHIQGVLHLGPRERISRYHFALEIARRLGADSGLVRDRRAQSLPGRAPRPKDVSLDTSRARAMLHTPMLGTDAGLGRVLGQ